MAVAGQFRQRRGDNHGVGRWLPERETERFSPLRAEGVGLAAGRQSRQQGDCVHSATPDGHKFTINVYTTAEEPGVTGEQTRAYLHWEDKDYGTRGWQVLAELERRPTNAAH